MTTVTITARYPGTCARTGAAIKPGDKINYDRLTRRATLVMSPPVGVDRDEDGEVVAARVVEPERYISDVIRIGRNTYYRNKRGRCEDAPCCGCCTI